MSSTLLEPPLHGNQGDRGLAEEAGAECRTSRPLGPTVAISREAGARGETIARRVGRKLGWDVLTREHLEYLATNETQRESIRADVPEEAREWLESQAGRLRREGVSLFDDQPPPVSQVMLSLAARGNLVFVGRGAGHLLPRESTLHVRVVAPRENRVGYMAQYLRLPRDEAAEQVRRRDEMRIDYIAQNYQRRDDEPSDFDLLVNSAELGEELAADLIVLALRAKQKALAE